MTAIWTHSGKIGPRDCVRFADAPMRQRTVTARRDRLDPAEAPRCCVLERPYCLIQARAGAWFVPSDHRCGGFGWASEFDELDGPINPNASSATSRTVTTDRIRLMRALWRGHRKT